MESNPRGVRKGAWTREEDILLRECIEKYGEGKWHLVPLRAGLNRCRKSCRLRWLNYLRPSIKRGDFAEDEIDLLLRLHKLLGNRWSLIAGRIPGRTANDVKNFWHTNIGKKSADTGGSPSGSGNCPVQANVVKPQPWNLTKSQIPSSSKQALGLKNVVKNFRRTHIDKNSADTGGSENGSGKVVKSQIPSSSKEVIGLNNDESGHENPKDVGSSSNPASLNQANLDDDDADDWNIIEDAECMLWWNNLLEGTVFTL